MKTLALLFLSASALSFVACAADTSAPTDDAEDTNVSQDELTKAAKDLVGDYEYRATESFGDFERLALRADGTYDASVASGLVDPKIVCVRAPCTAPESGSWSTYKSSGKLRLRLRPAGKGSRSYAVTKAGIELTLVRLGDTSILFQVGTNTCANVRCAAGTHCEMKGINGGSVPACIKDAPLAPCVRTGCSGQICADQHRISTCDWKPEYACYQQATCERQSDGTCGFTSTPALTSCLGNN